MQALVLEEKGRLALRDFPIEETLGPRDVRIAPKVVGICGSDVHYYTHGGIGPFVVRAPMILGHEAAGIVTEVGADVREFRIGDRVCMEPGLPDPAGRATRLGLYNLDPAVRFWATPPIHGVLRPSVVHPADFTFKLPDNVSFAAAAMVEPLAVGVHAVTKARVKPGDVAVVIGAGPIGLVTVLAALAAGCARVIVSDIDDAKLAIAAKLGAVTPVNVGERSLAEAVMAETDGWGADIVLECSGNAKAAADVFATLCPGGVVVYVGIPLEPIRYDVAAGQIKEARVEHVFRYAHVFPRCVAMLASGAIDVAPLITRTFPFADSIEAFDFAAAAPRGEVKVQIAMPD
ncbi:NAD(P)-dependent alcohol dehydrogenase [Segnochrobactrum spirostomi]|uniref:NAD(P)-dependent alcohol dehydrogenase n=1 Tax=Segnochrobactrum spirostomi TaxID=2608987 RepID=A0A6A7Y9X9_9HYPH|nr:NAD(P)-dependent alcohol dehydrogenase [Segnochrobactrum spirostomi]MQT14269.1 NAD(P)-dependent alcohol dehydrogenase [Segnochrobactrum spirostomi]